MARQIIDTGTTGNDGTGDDLRTGATKINDNFAELYGDVAALQLNTGSSGAIEGIAFDNRAIVFEGDSPDDAFETTFGVINPTKDNTIELPDSSGTVALVADITSIVDSNYVALLTGVAQDSNQTIILIQANSIDSAKATQIFDSSYIGLHSYISDSADFINHLGSIAGNLVPETDSTYDLGTSSLKWRDLHLSGQTIHLGGQTIKNVGGKFSFSQEVASGANNISVDSGQGFFVNEYANVSTGTASGSNAVQSYSLKLEGNTITFATVDGLPAAQFITNQSLLNLEAGTGLGLAVNSAAQKASLQGQADFRRGHMHYSDSNKFEFYDSDGWFEIKRGMFIESDATALVDSDYVQDRADKLKMRVYTVATAPSGVQGNVIYVSDGASGNPCLAVHDGTSFKRVTLGATIST